MATPATCVVTVKVTKAPVARIVLTIEVRTTGTKRFGITPTIFAQRHLSILGARLQQLKLVLMGPDGDQGLETELETGL